MGVAGGVDRDLIAAIADGPDIFSVLDRDGRVLHDSPSAERVHGRPPHEMIGRNPMELVHPDDVGRVGETLARLLLDPAGVACVQYRLLHRDGHWVPVEATGRNCLDDPRIRGIVVITRDRSMAGADPIAERRPIPVDSGMYLPAEQAVRTEGGRVPLARLEARLLEHLAARPGEVVTVQALLRDVWGYASGVRSRTVYATVDRLRRKVERDPCNPRCIRVYARLGYYYAPPR